MLRGMPLEVTASTLLSFDAPHELELTLLAGPSGPPVLRVAGELDLSTGELLKSACGALAREHGTLVVDLSGLTFIDGAGLRAVLAGLAAGPEGTVRIGASAACLDHLVELLLLVA
jgi:ABC-type transporter Mla MlaB component